MASVLNPGDPGRGVDKQVTPKYQYGAFRPNGEATQPIATSNVSQTVLLPRSATRPDDCVRIINTGTVAVRFRFGGPGSVAGPTDKAVMPNTTEVFRDNPGTTHIAAWSTAAGSIEVDCGVGT